MGILQILELTETSFKINTSGFNSILEKVADLPIVIISINGSSREGKSYALNYFIRYFKSQGSEGWFNTELQPGEMFSSKSGRERETVGMNLYTEPFKITTAAGKELGVLLLDCQGLFDDKTTFKQNAVIFALSNLFSSVLIYNVTAKIEENLLQNIQFFSSYAQAIKDEQENESILSPLTFLVRDFAFEYEYPLGYHSSEFPPEGAEDVQNYFQTSLTPLDNMPIENKIVRKEILSKFEHVTMFLMPFPGKSFLMNTSKNKPDEDFQYFLRQFVEMMVSDNFLNPKIINGREVTGRELQHKVIDWAMLCEESASKFPQAQTLAESQNIMRNEMAMSNAISIFNERFDQIFLASLDGVPSAELTAYFKTFSEEGIQMYQNVRRNERPEVAQEYLAKLRETFKDNFESYYLRTNQDILAQKQEQRQVAMHNQEVIQSLTQEILNLTGTSTTPDQSDVATEQDAAPVEKRVSPIKPKRKAPQTPNAIVQDNTIESNIREQWIETSAPSSSVMKQEKIPSRHTAVSEEHLKSAALSEKKKPSGFFSNFFNKFVKGSRWMNRRFRSLILNSNGSRQASIEPAKSLD